MAVNLPDDFLSKIGFIDENWLRGTLVAWLLAAHEDEFLLNLNPGKFYIFGLTPELTKYLNKNSEAGIFVKKYLLQRLVPQNHLNWIDGSHRQFLWMDGYISRLHSSRPDKIIKNLYPIIHQRPSVKPHHLQGLELNIAFVDYWLVKSFEDLDTAIRHCKEMEFDWKKLTESDKLFAWVDGVDAEKKRECFFSFLKDKYPVHISDYQKFKSHEDLLIFFDDPIFSRDTKELCSQKVRKTWNQRVRRENEKDRKQSNFNLPLQTIEKLEKLSKKHGVSRNDIIQILIESEYRNDVHISERLSRKHLLMAPLE